MDLHCARAIFIFLRLRSAGSTILVMDEQASNPGPECYKVFLDAMKRSYRPESFDALREELGLADCGNPLAEAQHSPTLVLALFSSLFAKPQPDWPAHSHVTGFAFYD